MRDACLKQLVYPRLTLSMPSIDFRYVNAHVWQIMPVLEKVFVLGVNL